MGVVNFYNENPRNIVPENNVVFVFGANTEAIHGSGSAKGAVDNFGAEIGKTEYLNELHSVVGKNGIMLNSFALITKDLELAKSAGRNDIFLNPHGKYRYDRDKIIKHIRKLYTIARTRPKMFFKVAYDNDANEYSRSGYTGAETVDMFREAGKYRGIPSNVLFNIKWKKIFEGCKLPPMTDSVDYIVYRGYSLETKRWVKGGICQHLGYTPAPIVTNGEKEKELQKIQDDTKFYIVQEEFSDWEMPRGVSLVEVDTSSIGRMVYLSTHEEENGEFVVEKFFTGDILQIDIDNELLPTYCIIDIEGRILFEDKKVTLNDLNHDYTEIKGFHVIGNSYFNSELMETLNFKKEEYKKLLL